MHLLRFVIVAIVLVVPAFAFALLYAAPFDPLRRNLADRALSSALETPVEVHGPIEVGWGLAPKITAEDIAAVEGQTGSDIKALSIKSASVEVPLLLLLVGQARLNALTMEGLRAEIDVPAKDDPGGPRDGSTARALSEVVRSPMASNLNLHDAELDYVDQESGIVLQYAFDSFTSNSTKEGGVVVAATGRLNDEPWKLDGDVDPTVGARATRKFKFDIVHAGLTAVLAGTYTFDGPGDILDVTVTAKAPSLDKLLTVYEISGDLEGEGNLSGQLTGPLEALKLSELALELALESGDTYSLSGDIANISAGTGIGLNLDGKIARPPPPEGEVQPIYDLGITGFNGRIEGSRDGLLLRDFRVLTNSVRANLGEIGPITAERLYRDKEGQLGLYDVLVLAGDPKRPSLRISGTVKDIIDFKGVDLKGTVDFIASDFFDLAAEEHSEALGHLTGDIALSDADGSLGIESLTAKITDSSLIKLNIDLVFDDIEEADEIELATHLDIPSFKPFAAALGSDVEDIGQVTFDGTVKGSDEKIVMTGTTRTGQTAFKGSLTGELKDQKPVLSGNIATEILYLSDLRKLAAIRAVYRENVNEADTDVLDYSKVWETLFVELQIRVAKIAGGGSRASNIDGKITYLDGVIGLDPLSLNYLGGRASANGKIDTKPKTTTFALKGLVENLSIGTVLKEMELSYPVRGALHVSYNLTGAGETAAQIMRSLNGSLSVSLHDGWIGSDLLNLTGMSLPAWLLSRAGSGNQAELVCLVAPFAFENGHGATHGLVMETRRVQVVGVGYIDFRRDAVDLRFKPQALDQQLIRIAQPFSIQGRLSDPQVRLSGAPVANAVAGVVAFPFNILGDIVQPHSRTPGHVPCRIVHKTPQPAHTTAPARPGGPLGLGIFGGGRRR